MKLTDDVYLVGSGQIELSNEYDCHIYLINGGDELALIDSGAGLNIDLILQNIRQEGLEPTKISRILVTHAHADHAAGCQAFGSRLNCKIIASKPEARLIESGTDEELGLVLAKNADIYPPDYIYPHCPVDEIIEDGDLIPLGRYSIKAIQTAGHSKGSVCYYMEEGRRRMLFTGDVVFFDGIIGMLNCPGADLGDYRLGMKKLEGLQIEALFPGHGLFCLRGGQKHIDRAIESLNKVYVPKSMGQ